MQDTFIIEQVNTFAVTIALGLVIGLAYDILRALKTVIRISRRAQFFMDLCYWFLMTVIVFMALLASNWGEVRAYVFIGLSTGGAFYVLVLSRPWFLLVSRSFGLIKAAIMRVTRPIVLLLRKVIQFFGMVWRKISGKALHGRQAVKKIKFKFSRKKKE
jgi:spore cortex biosynthesis protein YabQ